MRRSRYKASSASFHGYTKSNSKIEFVSVLVVKKWSLATTQMKSLTNATANPPTRRPLTQLKPSRERGGKEHETSSRSNTQPNLKGMTPPTRRILPHWQPPAPGPQPGPYQTPRRQGGGDSEGRSRCVGGRAREGDSESRSEGGRGPGGRGTRRATRREAGLCHRLAAVARASVMNSGLGGRPGGAEGGIRDSSFLPPPSGHGRPASGESCHKGGFVCVCQCVPIRSWATLIWGRWRRPPPPPLMVANRTCLWPLLLGEEIHFLWISC